MKAALLAICMSVLGSACVAEDQSPGDPDPIDELDTSETTQDLVGGGRCNAGQWYGSTLLINGWQHNGGSICCDGATVATIHACYTCSPSPQYGQFWCHLY
jgi:hypothetical protein